MKLSSSKTLIAALAVMSFAQGASAQTSPEWRYFGPDNTGIGGEIHYAIAEDRTGTIFGGGFDFFYSRGSVFRFKNGVFTNWGSREKYLSNDRVNDIVFTATNKMFVATDSGVVSYDGQTWARYTTANSAIAYRQVTSLAIDPVTGHLWATTRQYGQPTTNAVSHFNGTTWTNYSSTAMGLPAFSLLGNIAVDAQGNKWVANSRGLLKFNGTAWTLYDNANSGMSNYEVLRVQVDAQNKLWCVVGNGSQIATGIDLYDGASMWTAVASPGGAWEPAYVHARGNKVLVAEGGSFGRVFLRTGTTWATIAAAGSGDEAFDAMLDTAGRPWIAGKTFIKVYENGAWKRYTRQSSGLAEYDTKALFVDSKNRKWFANGNGGIQIYDCPKWEVIGPRNEGHWPNTQTQTPIGSSITEDRGNGDIWITYEGTNGIAVRIPNGTTTSSSAWTTYSNGGGIGTDNGQIYFSDVEGAHANHRGKVAFIGSYASEKPVIIFDRVANTWTTYRNQANGGPLSGGGASAIGVDTAGAFYFGSYQKIDRFHNGVWTMLNPATQGGPANFNGVIAIEFDAANNMWVGTSQGIWRFDGSTWTQWTTANSALTGPTVSSIAFHGNKVFAAAFNVNALPYGGGVSVLNGNTWTPLYHSSTPLAHYQINDLATDTSGNLWIATIEGTNVYKQGGTAGFQCLDGDRTTWTTLGTPPPTGGASYAPAPVMDATLYPNPMKEFTRVSLVLASGGEVSVRLLDMQGRTVQTVFAGMLGGGAQSIAIPRGVLVPGTYQCELIASDGRRVQKLVVE